MSKSIKKIAVLGTGVMGGQLAAHFANVGLPTLAFDISQENTQKGIEALNQIKPPPYFDPPNAKLITPCNYKDHLSRLEEADWIIESVVEELDVKLNLYSKILHHARPETIISSNTSGLSLSDLSQYMPPEFTKFFLVTHFFNPPRYRRLVEIVYNEYTRTEVINKVTYFCENVLGKRVIFARDVPNFIANRIGVYSILTALKKARLMNLSVETVDRLISLMMGYPGSAPFRTADIVGIDNLAMVSSTTYEKCPRDECRSVFQVPDLIKQMVEKNWLGQKTGQGFYKPNSSGFLTLDFNTLEYTLPQKDDFESLGRATSQHSSAEKIITLVNSDNIAGRFAWEMLSDTLTYAANRIPEVTEKIINIDNAMKWGFGWELGPFEIWQALGLETSAKRMKAEGKKVPLWIEAMLLTGNTSFYTVKQGYRHYFDMNTGKMKPVIEKPGVVSLQLEKQKRPVIRQKEFVSLLDLGEGVLCAMIDNSEMPRAELPDFVLLEILEETLEIIPREGYKGLLISSQGANSTDSSTPQLLLKLCRAQMWQQVERLTKGLQDLGQRLRYAPFPVMGVLSGASPESNLIIAMAADRVAVSPEFYAGFKEITVGLLPFGGSIVRILSNQFSNMEVSKPGPFPPVKNAFETILFGKISSSAAEAVKLGFLNKNDCILINPDYLISSARQTLLEMAENYLPPQHRAFSLPGEGGRLVLEVELQRLRRQGKIDDPALNAGKKLAYLLTGGDAARPVNMVDENSLLELELEAFLRLCQEMRSGKDN
jgi:3-hydroxyacyl-CoA dehydrogenase